MIEALELARVENKEQILTGFAGLDTNNIRATDTNLENGMAFVFPDNITVLPTTINGRTAWYCLVHLREKADDGSWQPVMEPDENGNPTQSVRRFFPGVLGRTIRIVTVDENDTEKVTGTTNIIHRAGGTVVEDYKRSINVDAFIATARQKCKDNNQVIVVTNDPTKSGWTRNIGYNPAQPGSTRTRQQSVSDFNYA